MALEQTIKVTDEMVEDTEALNDILMGLKIEIKTAEGQSIVRKIIEEATELDDYISANGVDEHGVSA